MNTNAWAVFVILIYCFTMLTAFGGTAFLIQVYGWSPWWFVLTVLIFGSLSIKTGGSR